jgi:nitrate reductase gamma subunit
MTDPGADRSLAEAVGLRRHVRRGFAAGLLLAAALFALFVLDPGTSRPAPLYLALAVVVAVTAGGLFTSLLVAAAVYRLVRRDTQRRP